MVFLTSKESKEHPILAVFDEYDTFGLDQIFGLRPTIRSRVKISG